MLNDTVTQLRNAMQPVISHQSLDSTITQNTSPGGISQNPHTSFLQSQAAAAPAATTSQTHVQIQPSTGVIVESTMPTTNTVPEFLYQLTKMLTDNNRDIIEWSNGEP